MKARREQTDALGVKYGDGRPPWGWSAATWAKWLADYRRQRDETRKAAV